MRTHPTDLLSLVPGVVAVAVAIVALAGGLTLDVLATDWIWPTVLVGLGLLVLATAGLGRRAPDDGDPPADDDPATDVADDEVAQA